MPTSRFHKNSARVMARIPVKAARMISHRAGRLLKTPQALVKTEADEDGGLDQQDQG